MTSIVSVEESMPTSRLAAMAGQTGRILKKATGTKERKLDA
jgi:hypothetical protein